MQMFDQGSAASVPDESELRSLSVNLLNRASPFLKPIQLCWSAYALGLVEDDETFILLKRFHERGLLARIKTHPDAGSDTRLDIGTVKYWFKTRLTTS